MAIPVVGLRRRDAYRFRPTRIALATHVSPPHHTSLSDGTKMGRLWRQRCKALVGAHSIRVTYANYYNNPGSGQGSIEADGPNNIFIAVVVEWKNSLVQITPAGGIMLTPGQQVSLDVPFECAAGDDLYFITQVAVQNLGEKWPLSQWMYQSNEGIIDTSAAPTNDVAITAATGNVTYAQEMGYGPATVTGIPTTGPAPCVLLVGDSIIWGVGGASNESFAAQALTDASIPYQNFGLSSSTARAFSTPSGRSRRMRLINDTTITHAIYEFLTNDLGFTTGVQADAVTCWRALAARRIATYAVTGLPHTTDVGGTIPGSNETYRTGYNDWLRGGAPLNSTTLAPVAVGTNGALLAGQIGHPLAGYFEAADIVETSRNSGQWKSGMTSDGIHPTAAGHVALKACIDTSKLVV